MSYQAKQSFQGFQGFRAGLLDKHLSRKSEISGLRVSTFLFSWFHTIAQRSPLIIHFDSVNSSRSLPVNA